MRRRTLIDSLFDSVDHALCLVRPDGAVLRTNAEFARTIGATDSLPRSWPPAAELLEHGLADPILIDGVEISVERTEHEGEPVALLHVRPTATQEWYRAAFEHLDDAVLISRAVRDDAGAVVDWVTEAVNDAFIRFSGLSREHLAKDTSFQRDPVRTAQVHPRWVNVLATGAPFNYTATTEGRAVLVRTVRVDREHIAIVATDVTKLVEAERALASTVARFEQLAELSPAVLFDFVTHADGTGGFTYVSPRVRDVLGVDAADLVRDTKLFGSLLTPASAAHLSSDEVQRHRSDELFTIDLEHRLPSGATRWIRYTRRTRPDPSGGVRGSGVMVDVTDERHALAEAERGRNLLDVLLEHVPSGIIVSELPDRTHHRMSRDAIDLLGFSPTSRELEEEVSVVSTDGRALARPERPLARALATGAPVRDLEMVIEGRAGPRTVLTSAAVSYVDGKPRTGLVTWHDITARKAADAALHAETERLRVTLRSIGDAVISTDVDARITLMNPIAERLTGWSQAEAAGRPLHEIFRIISEETREPVESPSVRVLREGVIVGLANHTLLITKDGHEVPIADAGAPIRDDSGKVNGVVLVFRDQTEERSAELALTRSRAGLLMIIDKLPIGIFVTRGGKLIYSNPAFRELLGYTDPKALVDRGPEEFLVPEEATPRKAEGPTQILKGDVWRARRADGHFVVIETAPLRDVEFDGAPAVLWAARDLSELRSIQAQLMQADRLASLGMLAAGIAHEINNPLAFTSASLDYLDEIFTTLAPRLGEDERADLADLLADARMGTTRVRDVVRDLKSFSRSEDGQNQPVDLLKLLESSLQLASTEIRHRSRLVRDYGPVPPVSAHEARLGQVFLNLLVNAAQAIPEGHAHENEIRVTTRTSTHGHAVVEISDTGTGIPQDALDRIFDPFFTTKPIGVGTGIGLAICRSTIVALGGEIRAVNLPERGAMFIVSLPPAAPPVVTADVTVPPPTTGRGRRGKILVIDDEPTIGAIVRRALHKDHEVTVLEAARAAVELLDRGERFDVVICDVMMPEMTGIEFYTHVAGTYPDQATKIVFLTGGAFTPKSAEFMEMVPNRRVEKPFDVGALRALIAQLVG